MKRDTVVYKDRTDPYTLQKSERAGERRYLIP